MRLLRLFSSICLLSFTMTAQAQQYVCVDSTVGDFCIRLFPDSAPKTVSNFLNYVTDNDYTDSLVHRSEPGFVIQGGGYTLKNGVIDLVPTDPVVVNEFSRSNLRGTVAMARQGGVVNSATSQWFINVANNSGLDSVDQGFTVFGEVVAGMKVVDTINQLRRANLSAALGTVPVTTPVGKDSVSLNEFVVIREMWATDTLPSPYYCTNKSPAGTLTEFCNGSNLTLPVKIGSSYYQATMQLLSASPSLVFTVDKSTLVLLSETPAVFASFNPANDELSIPSLRSGSKIFLNVVLKRNNKTSLQFTLDRFTKG